MRDSKTYNLLAAGAPRAITSSTNATPIVVTTTAAHGLDTGDTVQIMGHTTNVSGNGIWVITKVAASTFSLDGSVGVGTGANGSFTAPAPIVIDVQDFKVIVVSFRSDGGGDYAGVLKFAGAIAETPPNFGGTITVTNVYDFLDAVDLEDHASIDGDTGITTAGADDTRMFQINVDGLKWFTALHTEGTAGELTLEARLFSNK